MFYDQLMHIKILYLLIYESKIYLLNIFSLNDLYHDYNSVILLISNLYIMFHNLIIIYPNIISNQISSSSNTFSMSQIIIYDENILLIIFYSYYQFSYTNLNFELINESNLFILFLTLILFLSFFVYNQSITKFIFDIIKLLL